MDALDGVPLSRAANELDALDPATRRGLAEELLLAVLRQLLVTGIFHADLHGGNVMLLRDAGLALQDVSGLMYAPWRNAARVVRRTDVNYLACARKPE